MNEKIISYQEPEQEKKDGLDKGKRGVKHSKYKGFFNGKSESYKSKAKQILAKKNQYDGKVMSYQELVDSYIEAGGHAHEIQGAEGSYFILDSQNTGYKIPKLVYDYAKHIQIQKNDIIKNEKKLSYEQATPIKEKYKYDENDEQTRYNSLLIYNFMFDSDNDYV